MATFALGNILKKLGNKVKLILRRFLKCKWVLPLITSFKVHGRLKMGAKKLFLNFQPFSITVGRNRI